MAGPVKAQAQTRIVTVFKGPMWQNANLFQFKYVLKIGSLLAGLKIKLDSGMIAKY